MTSKTLSQRNRSNRRKGADVERRLAIYLRGWWPDACRAVRNTHPDPGDIDQTSPSLWWSVKDVADERINAWFEELDVKAADRIGLIVTRRRGYADPARWWCWMRTRDLLDVLDVVPGQFGVTSEDRCRLELQTVVRMLVAALDEQRARAAS